MGYGTGWARPLFMAAALASVLTSAGCAGHHGYRVYDAYYTDYHAWNHDEIIYYRQWCSETHRDSGRNFRKLSPEEQREYWTWRHNHGDHDRHHG